MADSIENQKSKIKNPDGHLGYLLTAYLFENLSEAGRAEVGGHLSGCAECRAQLERLRQTFAAAQTALAAGGKEYVFEERRRRRVLAAARQRPRQLEWPSFLRHWKLAAALLFIGVIISGLLLPTLSRSRESARRSLAGSPLFYGGDKSKSDDAVVMMTQLEENATVAQPGAGPPPTVTVPGTDISGTGGKPNAPQERNRVFAKVESPSPPPPENEAESKEKKKELLAKAREAATTGRSTELKDLLKLRLDTGSIQPSAPKPKVESKNVLASKHDTSDEDSALVVPSDILAKAELGDHWETVNSGKPDTHSAFGNPDANMFHSAHGSDEPAGGVVMNGISLDDVLGVGGPASPGSGGGWGGGNGTGIGVDNESGRGSFGNRNGGGRRLMVKRHGGSKATESTGDLALRWLAYHQEPDGHWDNKKYSGQESVDTPATSYALLAFLGAGHTEKVGEYKDNVKRAIAWLKSRQTPNGAINDQKSENGPIGYQTAVASLALSEAAGMGNVAETRAAAQKAIDWCTEKHQQGEGSKKKGWSNLPKSSTADLSVSGWFIMALKSAKVAGLHVNPASIDGAVKFLDTVEKKNVAQGAYGPASRYGYTPGDSGDARSCAIGNLCRQFLGWKKEDLQSSVELFMNEGNPPKWGAQNENDLNYWYFGTLCAFQQGGDLWKRWNEALKPALIENQCKEGDVAGSWDPQGFGAANLGRVGQTALSALCLEVYYRYAILQPLEFKLPVPGKVAAAPDISGEDLADSVRPWWSASFGAPAYMQGVKSNIFAAEQILRGYRHFHAENAQLTFNEYAHRPLPVPPPLLTDEGLEEDDYIEKYGFRPYMDCARCKFSTFGMDVDTASYTQARLKLRGNELPAPETVRVEEFVNYFKQPYTVGGDDAFGVFAEGGPSLFGSANGLDVLKIGIKSREPRADERKPAVLTFVVDTSGSMAHGERLELVRHALRMAAGDLRPEDAVCIVGFAGQAELLLPRTSGRQQQRILEAINTLTAGGGTNVEAGLMLGYRLADEAYSPDAVNRVILCSDGVANVGAQGPDEMLKMVKIFAARGIDLATVGFGKGEYNDQMMQRLADNGKGACYFVDTAAETEKVFHEQLPAHLSALARGAKVQIVFNPEVIERFRLLGYEKRKIATQDFRNDKVDGGEVGHSTLVTALYEVKRRPQSHGPLGKVFLRWKDAGYRHLPWVERNYPLSEGIVAGDAAHTAPELRFLECVARFADLLRGNPWARAGSYAEVLSRLYSLPPVFQEKAEWKEVVELVGKAQELTVRRWLGEPNP